ncbi:MAG: hydantoinase/oxoprolinase N-terminal domain-containing protein [Burkholderiaceae bacterium]
MLVANALIERKGVRVALITTRGFRDVCRSAWNGATTPTT